MGFSESESSKCRRHPNQKPQPGVCSSCLREKLTKLNTTSSSFNRRNTNLVSHSSSQSSTPPYSSASSSSTTATANGTRKHPGTRHRRNGSEAYVSVGMVLNDGLKKSRSVSCAPLSSRIKGSSANMSFNNEKIVEGSNKSFGFGVEEQDGNSKKKGGFLKRLIHSTNKKTKGVLTHSKTMKERSHSTTSSTTAKI